MIGKMIYQEPDLKRYRDLVSRLLDGALPAGEIFDGARAILKTEPGAASGFQAICVLLEGAMADAALPAADAQLIVPLLKNLAAGTIQVEDLL
jgi:hypothetical protein